MKKIYKNTIENIPGNQILKSLYGNNLPKINDSILEDVFLLHRFNEVHLKIIFNQTLHKTPKQWAKYEYNKAGILLKCVNIKKLKIDIENSNLDIKKLDYLFIKKGNFVNEVQITDTNLNIMEIESEAIYFDEPFGIKSENINNKSKNYYYKY